METIICNITPVGHIEVIRYGICLMIYDPKWGSKWNIEPTHKDRQLVTRMIHNSIVGDIGLGVEFGVS